MKNLIKATLIAAAFVFAAGCSTNEGTRNTASTDTVSNVVAKCPGKHHNKCKKHHCKGKLGVEKNKCDTNK